LSIRFESSMHDLQTLRFEQVKHEESHSKIDYKGTITSSH
jgi:hypothetical protein